MNTAMYLLVNKDITMSAGKMAGQVAHAAVRYAVSHIHHPNPKNDAWINSEAQTKIIVWANQSLLEKLEKEGYVTIRDHGKTELVPGTITVVCAGIYERGLVETRPNWLKRLRLV